MDNLKRNQPTSQPPLASSAFLKNISNLISHKFMNEDNHHNLKMMT